MKDIYSQIIKFCTVHEASAELMAFGDVTMVKDFGPLKKGEKHDSVWFKAETATVEVYNESGERTHEFHYEIVAK